MAPTVSIEFAGHRESKKLSQKFVPRMMGKTRKVSKGYPRGFVPDYRHAVETMAESEGFGSSGQLDVEMTASEEPRAPKRKCITLNGDSYEQFGVPIQVLSLSKLSSLQRKDMVMRLKHELEQVRTYRKEIATVSYGDVALFPPSDIQSCSAGQKRLIPEISRSAAEPVSHSMKRVPPGRNAGGRTKKPASGRFDSVNKALPPASGNAMLMKQCETLLNRLIGHTFGWVFKVPVDVVALKIPDYYTVIKNPMDLGTVRTKLTSGKYADPWGFAADVRLTFSNALTYNPGGNDVHAMAETISKFFEVRWKQIEKKLLVATDTVVPPKPTMLMETETAVPMSPLKKKKTAPVDSEVKQVPAKRVMSDVERHKLSSELESSLADLPDNIIDFLKENSSNGYQTTEDEIEIDIDTLSNDTLLILRKLLDDYLADTQKNMVKAETCEIELRNELGFSKSSIPPCKANDLNKEDVDIRGNDLPISTFPPVEREKDSAVRKSSKCSNSSSSSSEDGSSSSDSSTSSGSDAVDARISAVVNNMKLTLGSEKTAITSDAEPENLNGVRQVEQKSRSNPVSGEVDDRQEGESAQSKRQVSPVNLYRAALLKGRFADTILKAQEKTVGKDPERPRLEKEELEKRRRTEKARLQAEAKAAEEARRNAEAKAAAEAKRKREVEREAARQALQKMEKTVDIDENSQFLEDLQLLQAEPLQSLIDETSPVHSLDPLGSFKFQGNGNPLEQLGLYMKDEDEEEEEVKPQVTPATIDDPEEGEID